MVAKRRQRKTRPAIFVFCEGKTEELYVDLLRTSFRVPIKIVTKITGTKINQQEIDRYLKIVGYPDTDKVFLFYDGDRDDIRQKLFAISNAEVILTCPCIEFWYLLHFTMHSRPVKSDEVERLLRKYYPMYDKGAMKDDLKVKLIEMWQTATNRAKRLTDGENPSTTAYRLPEYLKSITER